MDNMLADGAEIHAVRPWFSLDAVTKNDFERLPQQKIEVCLMCQHCASHCDICDEWNVGGRGRPRKEIDTVKLAEMLRLRRCNRDICTALGISERTLQRAKKTLQ